MLDHLDIGEQIDHLTQSALVQLRTGKVLGQNILQPLVLFLNTAHGVVDHGADFRRVGGSGNYLPPSVLWHEKDVFGCVFVLVLLEAVAFLNQLLVLGLKTVGNVLQKDQAQNNRFIFRGIHITPQNTGSIPDLLFKADVTGIGFAHRYFPRYVKM